MDLFDLNEAFKKSLSGFFDVAVTTFKWFEHSRLSQFYDITIKLEDNKEIRAHKAILVSRLEYFKMMFIHSWSEVRISLILNKLILTLFVLFRTT